jgi:hypothetical protein
MTLNSASFFLFSLTNNISCSEGRQVALIPNRSFFEGRLFHIFLGCATAAGTAEEDAKVLRNPGRFDGYWAVTWISLAKVFGHFPPHVSGQ